MTKQEIAEMVQKYDLQLMYHDGKPMIRVGYVSRMERDGARQMLVSAKEETVQYLREIEDAKKRAYEEKQAKIDAIPGLKEIKSAMDALDKYHEDFDRAYERGDGIYPMRPKTNLDELLQKYPQARTYLQMEREANKMDPDLSRIGQKALDMVIDGDWEGAIEYQKQTSDAWFKEHAWD